MATFMNSVGKWVVVTLIILGICYNFILPFTPVWLDVVAWSAICLAFLIAVVTNRRGRHDQSKEDQAA